MIMSLNWETRNLTETRDYAIVTARRREVAEIAACFDSDWQRRRFDPGPDARLIWCNLNGRNRIARFIDAAKKTLFLQNERYQDEVIIERLVRAARRGVKLHVLARPAHTLKKGKLVEGVEGLRILHDVGARVHRLHGLKLHAKLMVADGTRCIVGSINLAPGSFDSRRELAIEVDDRKVMKPLHRIVKRDWKHSRPLDLSDAGLLADLTRDADEAAEILALDKRKKPRSRK
jgi:phosphatidylserine/phosphatidylglycerophosphate/cardiolipin synthase-like enzyme